MRTTAYIRTADTLRMVDLPSPNRTYPNAFCTPQLLEIYGHDVYVFLFRSLINHLDLKNAKAVTDQTRLQLLAQELGTVMNR